MKRLHFTSILLLGSLFFTPQISKAGLADIFVEVYDKVKTRAVEPLYDTLKEYIVETKLLAFIEDLELNDPELEAKYEALITSDEFDETYFPFLMAMMEQLGALKSVMKAEGGNVSSGPSFLEDPAKREYLKTVLIIFGKLFLYNNGEEVAVEAIDAQIRELAKNKNLPEFVIHQLETILADEEKSKDLYHMIGSLVKSIGQDYLHDFQMKSALRQAKLQWLESAGLKRAIEYFESSLHKKRAVMVLVDGVGGNYLEDLLSENEEHLPTLSDVYSDSVWVERSVASTPTISTRNISILSTGVTVADYEVKGEAVSTGIPNFTYVNRQNQEWMYFWGRDGLRLRELINTAGAPTIFETLEHFHTVSHASLFDTGADDRFSSFLAEVMSQVRPGLSDQIGLASLQARAQKEIDLNRKRQKLVNYLKRDREKFANDWFYTDQHYENYAVEILNTEDEGLPDFFFWYDPWVDHKSHEFGTHANEVIGAGKQLSKFDHNLGVIKGLYQHAGIYGDTLFGLVSDHGQINIKEGGNMKLDEELFASLSTATYKKISSDEGAPPKIDRTKSSVVGYDFVVGSTAGGSFVIDAFNLDSYNEDGSISDFDQWARHPRFHQLQKYQLFSGETVDVIAELKSDTYKDHLDYFLVREQLPLDDPAVDSVVRVISHRGEARVVRRFSPDVWKLLKDNAKFKYTQAFKELKFEKYWYKYELVADSVTGKIEADPLGITEQSEMIQKVTEDGSWLDQNEWLRVTADVDRLDAIHEISHIYDTQLAGTINVFPKADMGFNCDVPGRHAGEQFEEKNSLQAYFGGAVTTDEGYIGIARGGSVPVTLVEYLMGENFMPYDFDFESLLGDLQN